MFGAMMRPSLNARCYLARTMASNSHIKPLVPRLPLHLRSSLLRPLISATVPALVLWPILSHSVLEAAVQHQSSSLSATLSVALSYAAPYASQIVFLAPMQAMKIIKGTRTTGDMSAIPYVAMMTNGMVWVMYGALKADWVIWLPNISGALFGAYYTYTFLQHSPVSLRPHLAVSAGIIATAGCVCMTLPPQQALGMVGLMGVGVVVAMFSGPLASIRVVLSTRSTRSLHLGFCLATVLNCFLWSAYGGFVVHDNFITLPNIAGLGAGLAQLVLFAMFRR